VSAGHSTDYDAGSARRDALLAETLRLHDLHYGTGHCDRKYVQVCSRFQALLFEAGGVTPPGPSAS
jgi:hypothetical protein